MPVERADVIIGGVVVLLLGTAAYPVITGGQDYTPSEKCGEVSMMLEQLWQANRTVTADVNQTIIDNLRNASGSYQQVSCSCSPLSQQDEQALETPRQVEDVTERGEELSCTIDDPAFPGGQHSITFALTQITGGNRTGNATIVQ